MARYGLKKHSTLLMDTHPELLKEWDYEKNVDYDINKIATNSCKKVWWIGPCGHSYQAHISDKTRNDTHHKSTGCPYCSGKVLSGFNDLETLYPDIAKLWHPTKNGDVKPSEISPYSHKKCWWYLPYDDPKTGKHFDFEWQVSVKDKTQYQNGCPYLSGKKILPGFNDLQTLRPDIAAEWHPTKNGDLTPDQVSPQSHKTVWWIYHYDDPITGKHFDFEWEGMIKSRVRNNGGCPYIDHGGGSRMVWPGYNDLATTHPDIAKELHPTKNKNITAQTVTAGSSKVAWWICPNGHEYHAVVNRRTFNEQSCPFCTTRHQPFQNMSNVHRLDNKYYIVTKENGKEIIMTYDQIVKNMFNI